MTTVIDPRKTYVVGPAAPVREGLPKAITYERRYGFYLNTRTIAVHSIYTIPRIIVGKNGPYLREVSSHTMQMSGRWKPEPPPSWVWERVTLINMLEARDYVEGLGKWAIVTAAGSRNQDSLAACPTETEKGLELFRMKQYWVEIPV